MSAAGLQRGAEPSSEGDGARRHLHIPVLSNLTVMCHSTRRLLCLKLITITASMGLYILPSFENSPPLLLQVPIHTPSARLGPQPHARKTRGHHRRGALLTLSASSLWLILGSPTAVCAVQPPPLFCNA